MSNKENWKRRALAAEKELALVRAELPAIRKSLDVIESNIAWAIRAEERFSKGQRVELSRKARARNILPKTRHDRKGTVTRVENAFSVLVQFDGYARPRGLHHSFLNPVAGPKLF